MNIQVHRDRFTEMSTGSVVSIDGTVVCYGLEPPRREPTIKPRCIPAGTYSVIIAWSPKHDRWLPLVENVPDFEGIEIHIGNWPKDTEGCLLVGEERAEDAILHSTNAFVKFFALIEDAARDHQPITITYTEAA